MAKKKTIVNDKAPRAPKEVEAPVVHSHSHAAELADFNVIEARTKSAGVIEGLKPRTKYFVMEAVDGADFEPIHSADIGDKIRKGIVVTKLFDKE